MGLLWVRVAHLCAGARNGGSVVACECNMGRCVKPTPWAEADQSIDTPAAVSLTPKKDRSASFQPASQSKKAPRMDGSLHASITNHQATPVTPSACSADRRAWL